MPTNIFDTILANGIRAGQIPARQNTAREWYRAKARGTVVSPESLIKEEKARYRNTITIGKMYLFQYDPKHKATLPYYDTFPVIFPVDLAEGGFYGLNLHYLPIKLRAQLMNALYQLSSNTKYDDKTKLQISYKILKAASKYSLFKPTFKHYLTDHVRSRFIEITSSEWDIAAFLPVQRFQKASQSKIWSDSRKLISAS